MRKIIHIDMDAFFASVEQRDSPDLKGKPVAVGGSTARGVVAAASYEARKYGVRSAMPSLTAVRLCPDLVFVHPRFNVYKEVSTDIRNIFTKYTDLVEPLSLDEAYLDVTKNKKQMPSATLIAQEIKSEILKQTKLTASAGVSFNKFLAKIASDMNKPDGIFVIRPEGAQKFIDQLPIERFYGIGKVTGEKMHKLGITTGLDLRNWSEKDLKQHFGKMGMFFHQIAQGIDNRKVNPNRIRKSLGAENTFEEDLMTMEEIEAELKKIMQTVLRRMDESSSRGKTLTLKVKYADFQQITRSKTTNEWLESEDQLNNLKQTLLENLEIREGIRLLGLTISNLEIDDEEKDSDPQLTLSL